MSDRVPRVPPGLSKRAGALWRAVVDGFTLSDAELEVLRSACEALDRADAAGRVVKREGVVVLDRYGTPKAHPAVETELRARALFAAHVRQLGVKATAPPAVRPIESARGRKAAKARWDRGA